MSQELADYLQRLSFEKIARESVVDRIITSHKGDPDGSVLDSPAFKHYMAALADVTAEYELAKSEVPSKCFPWAEGHEVEWSIDFASRKALVKVLCGCEIADA